MSRYKPILKDLFYQTGTVHLLDKLMFGMSYIKNNRKNALYRKLHKDIAFPPDYYIYETYRLNYEAFVADGVAAAAEIVTWTNKYLTSPPKNVLEWGCGVGRIVSNLHTLYEPGTRIYGCDINAGMIDWNKGNIQQVVFSLIDLDPPMNYPAGQFDMVYAISVFTHIPMLKQEAWLQEMHRIINAGGVFLFTTHGQYFYHQLLSHEKQELEKNGLFTRPFYKNGHRMMSTYHVADRFAALVKNYFEILEFWDGAQHQSKTGGQDLWIVRKNR